MTDTTVSDDEWWEMVSSVREQLALDRGCDRESWCFTFACQCRHTAIRETTLATGVSYENDN